MHIEKMHRAHVIEDMSHVRMSRCPKDLFLSHVVNVDMSLRETGFSRIATAPIAMKRRTLGGFLIPTINSRAERWERDGNGSSH